MPFRRNFSAQSSMHLSTLEKYPFLYAKYYDVFSRLWCHHSAVSKKKTKKHRFENTQNAKKKKKEKMDAIQTDERSRDWWRKSVMSKRLLSSQTAASFFVLNILHLLLNDTVYKIRWG